MSFFLIFLNIFLLVAIIKYRLIISNKLNLTIRSDKFSIHRNNSYLLGGLILLITFFFSYLSIIKYDDTTNYYFNVFIILAYFFISLLDDIYKISPLNRLFFLFIVTAVIIYFDNSLTIRSLNSYYLGFLYFPENTFIRYFFPILCLIVFVNAFNFIDGIDGLASLVGISLILYLVFKNIFLVNYLYLFLITILILIFANFKKSIFLGDSGNYLISIVIGTILIKENFKYPTLYYAEEIFLMLLIPGIDLIRLFLKRIKNKKSPLIGDKNHLHHLLYFKYGKIKSIIFYLFFVNCPIYLFYFNKQMIGLSIISSIILYIFILFFLSENKNKEIRK